MRSQSGQSTVELAGTIVWVLLAGLFALQLALVGWSAVSAGNAARTAARLISRGVTQADARDSAVKGLADRGLVGNVQFPTDPGGADRAAAHVKIPAVFPGVTLVLPNLGLTEYAEMPPTG